MLDPVTRPPTLVTATADRVRDAIFRGELQMAMPLREVELSKSLNVSRGTVREALRLLQEEGLVEVITHRGAFVASLSFQTINEVYTLRALLEPYAVAVALKNKAYSEEDLEALDELVRQMGKYQTGRDGFSGSQADVDFHYLMCKPSDHQLLLQIIRNLQSQTRLCMLNIQLYDSGLPSNEVHHRQILDAIRLGTPSHAAEIVRQHIDDSRIALLAQIERMAGAKHFELRGQNQRNGNLSTDALAVRVKFS